LATTLDLDMLPDPAIIADAAGLILDANSQAAAWSGYSIKALKGMSVDALVPLPIRPRHQEHRERYNQAPRQRPMSVGRPLAALLASGDEAFVDISLGPLGEGRTLALIRDVTHRIKAEQEYRASRTQLIDALERMNRMLEDDLRSHDQRLLALEEDKTLRATSINERLRALEDA
jgi:PAS domain S-box-containing protein